VATKHHYFGSGATDDPDSAALALSTLDAAPDAMLIIDTSGRSERQ
jgi:hypothetical protein